ncbi:MAG TPA: TonB-dependent receptor [Burkholderiales bacterium]
MLRYGASVGKLDYRLTASYRADDTYPGIPDSRRLRLLTLRADYRLGNRDSLSFQGGYNGGHREMGGTSSGGGDPTNPVRTITTDNWFQQLKWLRTLDGGDELSVQLYHNHLGLGDSFYTDPIAQLGNQQFPLDNSIRADRYDAEVQHTVHISRGLRWVGGASVRYDHSEAPIYLTAPVSNQLHRVFGHAEWRPTPRWIVNAGAMVERTEFTGPEVSPRLAVNYRLAAPHTLRASISRAVRNPSLFEEKADLRFELGPVRVQRFRSSGNLQPERILSREVGYIGEFPRLGLSFDARVFYDEITGLIGAVTVPFPAGYQGITRDFRNQDDVTQRGFETQLRWRFADATALGVAQSYIDTHGTDIGGPYSKSTPRNIYSAFIIKPLGELTTATIMAFHQDAVEPLGFSEPRVAFNRVDARIARSFTLGRSRAEAAFVVQNLFNYKYTDFRHDNVFDRRSYVTLELNF